MDHSEFYDRLKREVLTSQESFGEPTLARGFAAWIGTYLFEIVDKEECRNSICDQGNDQGIDGVFFDEETKTVEIVQLEFPQKQNMGNSFSENKIVKTLAGVRLITRGEFRGKVAPRLEELAKRYIDAVNGSGYRVKVSFVSLYGPPVNNLHVDLFRKDFETVTVEFIGLEPLKKFFEKDYLNRRARPPEKVAFAVVPGTTILTKHLPKESVVFTIAGVDLAKSVIEYGARLFQDNVRLFLGSRKRSPNIKIQETAESNTESSFFWYYNNGINIVCRQLEIPPTQQLVTLHHPQIVNGAQTSFSLANALKDGNLKPEALVLVKAVADSDPKFISNLTLYTNSQNPVRLRDFAANDSVQIKISKLCGGFKHFYEKKRGEFEDEYPTSGEKEKAFGPEWKDRIISNERAAQYYMSWELQRPSEAKAQKGNIFNKEKDGLYFDIFNDRTIPEEFVFLHMLGLNIGRRIAKYEEKYGQTDPKARLRTKEVAAILKDDFLLYSDLFIIALMRHHLTHQLGLTTLGPSEYVDLIEKAQRDPTLFDKSYDAILKDLRPFFVRKKTDLKYYHAKYFKNPQAYGELKNHLREELNRSFIPEA